MLYSHFFQTAAGLAALLGGAACAEECAIFVGARGGRRNTEHPCLKDDRPMGKPGGKARVGDKKSFDPLGGRSKNCSGISSRKFRIPIKYRNCNFFSVS